jgi:hypothetical protein
MNEARDFVFMGGAAYDLDQDHTFYKQLLRHYENKNDATYASALSTLLEDPFEAAVAGRSKVQPEEKARNAEALTTIMREGARVSPEVSSGRVKAELVNLLKGGTLTLYVRHGSKIHYGPIADVLLIAASKFVNEYSRFFSHVQVVGTRAGVKVHPDILGKHDISPLSVKDNDFQFFETHTPFVYLSHSSNGGNPIMSVASGGMEAKEGQIQSAIELEEDSTNQGWRGKNIFAKESNVEAIVKEFIDNLVALEENLAKLIPPRP